MLSVIGIGQAGGSVADNFASKGIDSLVINYSQKDLDSCENINDEKKLKLVGTEGVGKQRDYAIKLMNQNWESTLNFIKNHVSQPSSELIFVVFSTAGGTGSGISPLITDMLINELDNKTIVTCPILPDINESTIGHLNTLNCLKELSSLDICILPIDNNNFSHLGSKNKVYSYVNESFSTLILNIILHTEMYSKHGNFDQKDLITVFGTKGFANISHVNISNIKEGFTLTSEYVSEQIVKSWNKSLFTKPDTDKIIRYGFIFDAQEQLMQYINISSILSNFSNQPLDVFEGYYHQNKGDVYSILTGLQFNKERLKEMENKTLQQSEILSEVISAPHSIQFKQTNIQIKKQPQKKNISDILKKYQK
ncbi:tubulin-like doman-containing protein [Bacillus smithii]|uniref:tubulin-like doman-containing protein n=1 Tax=Bacillus smithii TaxID=1479 RepID=UPI003D1E2BB5